MKLRVHRVIVATKVGIMPVNGSLWNDNILESRKKKAKNWEEDDFYDSDDDSFLDRTGDIERKRQIRMNRLGKRKQSPETYDSLVGEVGLIDCTHSMEHLLGVESNPPPLHVWTWVIWIYPDQEACWGWQGNCMGRGRTRKSKGRSVEWRLRIVFLLSLRRFAVLFRLT